MDKAELDRLKGLEAGATKGPWQMSGVRFKWREAGSDQVLDSHTVGPNGDAICLVFYVPKWHAEQLANAAFIAASRSALPALIAENERLESENARLQNRLNTIATAQVHRTSYGFESHEEFAQRLKALARSATGGG